MTAESSITTEETARLRYRCRRGMLELDALLARFISSPAFAELTAAQRQTFELLLDEPDPQLLGWLMGQEVCEKKGFRELIEMIQIAHPVYTMNACSGGAEGRDSPVRNRSL